jgi:acyl-CoA-binding protein
MAAAPETADLKARFVAAVQAAKQARTRPDNQTLLKLYAYYKQATEGDAGGERPGAFDFVRGAKFDAWAKLKGSSRDDAMRNYIGEVDKLDLNRDP